MTEPLLRSGSRAVVPLPGACSGFTYLGLLFVVAAMGIVMATAAQVWQTAVQREKEKELLFVGNQIREAIKSYHEFTPDEDKQFPRSLQDLLLDPRAPGIRRHLRKLYADPMTGKPEWGLVLAEEGGIQGVYSLSKNLPFKQSGFPDEYSDFEKKLRYDEWKFIHQAEVSEKEAWGQDGDGGEDPAGS
jgi:type II secretory pathway pseudopilin PulG